MYGYMGAFSWIWIILFWGLVIWVIIKLVNNKGITEKRKPIDIIKERYAKGELTKKQFEFMKKDLAG